MSQKFKLYNLYGARRQLIVKLYCFQRIPAQLKISSDDLRTLYQRLFLDSIKSAAVLIELIE